MRMLFSSNQAVCLAIQSRAKIVHLHDPELIPYIPLLRILGRIVIFDAHEDLPTQVLDKSYLSPVIAKAVSTVAKGLMQMVRLCDAVVAATETIAERLPSKNVVVIHNYPPLRDEEAEAVVNDVGDRPARVVYIGGMSVERGASVMIDALSDEDMPEGWRLNLAGSGPAPLMERLASQAGWKHVDYVGQVPPDEARDLILGSRVGLVLFQDNPAHRDSLPTKMFEYFAAGVPVIASNFPLWQTIVTKHACGQLVRQDSPKDVAAALKLYASNPELLTEHSHNARELALTTLNWAPEGERLVAAYREIIRRAADRADAR
jgi:glycosyltransferase involved in cell wall biosynthesis